MNLLDLETEVGALAGYTIGTTGQDLINKTRARRRIAIIKSDVISRYGGKWDANYREGWLALVPLYSTGTVDLTQGSRAIVGHSTVWTSDMKGRKIIGPDGAYYKIASVSSNTALVITEPYQGTTLTLQTYQIWQDEYILYPEVLTLGGFVDYNLPKVARESWAREMKESYPKSLTNDEPTVYTVIGRNRYSASYSTGTITGAINSNVITGSGTLWQANIQPGAHIIIGSYTYNVYKVNSDTEIELYQMLAVVATNATYSAISKNQMIVRFKAPTTQQIVNYWFWAKDYALVNDNDEDWVSESYPNVLVSGVLFYDYTDKNDPIRMDRSKMAYEDMIKNMKVAVDGGYTGARTIPYNIPNSARE